MREAWLSLLCSCAGRTVPSHAVAPPPPGWTLLKPVKKASPESILRRAPNQKGKVAVITGGNDGIGYETARVLAGAGARVIIASRNERRSAKAAAALYQGPGEVCVQERCCPIEAQSPGLLRL